MFRFRKPLQPNREVGFSLGRHLEVRACCNAPEASSRTSIIVHVDLGPSNGLFVRGQGGGLNWNLGQPLTRIERAIWTWSGACLREAGLEFQLLIDDMLWERSEPHLLQPGHTIHISPDFEWPEIPRVSPPARSLQPG